MDMVYSSIRICMVSTRERRRSLGWRSRPIVVGLGTSPGGEGMPRRAPAPVRPSTARGCGEHVLGIPDTRKLRAARGVSPAMGTPPSRRARSETGGRRSARSLAGDARPDRRATGAALQRRRSESNRRSRICSPLPYHLATAPKEWGADERAPHTGFARAGNRTRTGDPHLGKVVLYQLSYSRR